MKRNHKGFTLAELLIVVAVIAVLVAVAIPTFSNQLEKSRQSVDVTYLRDAYAAAQIAAIDGYFIDNYSGGDKVFIREIAGEKDSATPNPGPFIYLPTSGELTAKPWDSLKTAGLVPYGRARSKTVVADTGSLNDLGIEYKPGTLKTGAIEYGATMLAAEQGMAEREGSAMDVVGVYFVTDTATGKSVATCRYIRIVGDDGNILTQDNFVTIYKNLTKAAGLGADGKPATGESVTGVTLAGDSLTNAYNKMVKTPNNDGQQQNEGGGE